MLNRLEIKTVTLAIPVLMLAVLPLISQASPQCTKAPKSAWLTEAQMKEKIAGLGFRDIRVFKTTKSGCYEIYGLNSQGRKVEVYFDPTNGSIVELNQD